LKTKIKILHLENIPADAELVERQLNKGNFKFEILVVNHKAAYENALKEFAPHIILANHSLPSFDSLEAIKIMMQNGIEIPFILVTESISDNYVAQIIKAGISDYIFKDHLQRLPQAIVNAVELYRSKQERQVIKAELVSSQLHLTEVQTIAKVGSWETDLQTFKVKWSDQTHHIFETDPKKFEATHESFLYFVHPDDRDSVNIAFENSFNSQIVNYIEHRIITKKGKIKNVIESWKIINNGNENEVRAVGTCQDITERKTAEDKLITTTEELRTISERLLLATTSAKIGIWDWDVVNNILIWDKTMFKIFGVSEDKFCGAYHAFSSTIHPADFEKADKAIQDALAGADNFYSEFRVIWPDQSVHYIEAHAIITRDKTGRGVRMIGGNMDITEKKKLEKAVQNERDDFFTLFSKAPSAIGMLKGANHVFEMVNPPYLQLIGKKDIIGKTVADVLPEVIEQGFVSMLDHVYATGNAYKASETLVLIDKERNGELTEYYINFVFQAYKNTDGAIEGVSFFVNDVTEQVVTRKAI